jgi:hypothetical protein
MRVLVLASVILTFGMATARAEPAPAASTPPAAQPVAFTGGDHTVRVTNAGKSAVSAIYVARSGSTDFSDDLLGSQTAAAGKTVTVKVRDPKADCVFDMQFLTADARTITQKGVDLCQTSAVSVGS